MEKTTNAELLASLRQEIAVRGLDRKATARIMGELLIHVSLAIAGMVIFFISDDWWEKACALIVACAGSLGVGTNTHTSSHYGTSSRKWVNEALTYFGYPFFLGLSATFWWWEHITVHHPAPNVVGVDLDCDLSPWFAMTRDEVEAAQGVRRFYYEKLQWLIFPIALSMNAFNYVKTGVVYVIGALRDSTRRRRANWIDLGALILHFTAYLGLPLLFFPAREVVIFYLLRTVVLGYGMFVALAPGHFPAEAACLSADQKDADYLLMQTAGTINYKSGLIGRLVTSGLGYQIEHHLFPHLSHVNYRKLSPLVEKMCREQGLPYHTFTWDQVIWKCWMVIRHPRPIVKDVETLRLPINRKMEMAKHAK